MAEDGFEIGADLDAHASQLEGVSDGLKQAIDAATQVSMPTDAYGIICQPFRMLLDPVEEFGINALKEAVAAMDVVSKNLRTAAAGYQSADADVSARLRAEGGQDV